MKINMPAIKKSIDLISVMLNFSFVKHFLNKKARLAHNTKIVKLKLFRKTNFRES